MSYVVGWPRSRRRLVLLRPNSSATVKVTYQAPKNVLLFRKDMGATSEGVRSVKRLFAWLGTLPLVGPQSPALQGEKPVAIKAQLVTSTTTAFGLVKGVWPK